MECVISELEESSAKYNMGMAEFWIVSFAKGTWQVCSHDKILSKL